MIKRPQKSPILTYCFGAFFQNEYFSRAGVPAPPICIQTGLQVYQSTLYVVFKHMAWKFFHLLTRKRSLYRGAEMRTPSCKHLTSRYTRYISQTGKNHRMILWMFRLSFETGVFIQWIKFHSWLSRLDASYGARCDVHHTFTHGGQVQIVCCLSPLYVVYDQRLFGEFASQFDPADKYCKYYLIFCYAYRITNTRAGELGL